MFTKDFWLRTLERAIKSAAQFGLIAWGATVFTAIGDVMAVGTAVGFALLFGFGLSVLTSVASIGLGDVGTPSLIKAPEAPSE
jgi:Putative lactococcus lactis phage r1t holin